jgi:hypothetical protein
MPGGTVAAQSDTDEFLLLSGEDGHTIFRSEGVRFVFDDASSIGNAVLAVRAAGNGTNEVMAIDPAVGGIVFHGRLPQETIPLACFGAGMPGHFLASMDSHDGHWIQVVNGRGENTNKWRLPRSEDIRGAQRCRDYPSFADGLILMIGQDQVLAYEHDPGEGGGKL